MLSGNDDKLLGGVVADKAPVIAHCKFFFFAEINDLFDAVKMSR